ncbi:hypothetical protein COO60DRAFT_352635 [Scenedesmus sp. NREL 46B-D3]|nr:hypothetical protein COO60DRAFT_352635 [Scenedesmus sp. NREL 46B-D3]
MRIHHCNNLHAHGLESCIYGPCVVLHHRNPSEGRHVAVALLLLLLAAVKLAASCNESTAIFLPPTVPVLQSHRVVLVLNIARAGSRHMAACIDATRRTQHTHTQAARHSRCKEARDLHTQTETKHVCSNKQRHSLRCYLQIPVLHKCSLAPAQHI